MSSSDDEENQINIINPLCVTIIGARNLPLPKDGANTWTDKYAQVRIGDNKQQTVTRSSHPNAVQWGDTLQFDIAGFQADEEIWVSVYIQYKIAWEMLGEIRIPLDQYSEVNRRYALEHWYTMGTGGGFVREDKLAKYNKGEIGLIIGVFEGEGKRLKRRHVFSVDDPYFNDKGTDEIYVEANEVAKENKEMVDRIVRVAENTRETGAATLAKLNEQSEQIIQAQQDVDTINEQITFSEGKLKTIESSCTGCCSCFEKKKIGGDRLREEAVRAEKFDKMRMKAKARAAREQKERDKAKEKNHRFGAARDAPKQQHSAAVLLSQEGEFKKTVQEIDAGLDQVNYLVQDLKGIAGDMGHALDEQNTHLQKLNEDFQIEQARMARVTDRTKRLI